MSTSCYHTNYSNQKNNKNTGLPHSLRSFVMTGANSGLSHLFVMTGAESFLYPPYSLETGHYLKNPHPPQVAATSPFSNKGEVKNEEAAVQRQKNFFDAMGNYLTHYEDSYQFRRAVSLLLNLQPQFLTQQGAEKILVPSGRNTKTEVDASFYTQREQFLSPGSQRYYYSANKLGVLEDVVKNKKFKEAVGYVSGKKTITIQDALNAFSNEYKQPPQTTLEEAQNKIVPNGFGTLFAQANNMGMQRYTITPTDTTVKEVARKLFGDDNYAYSIALANGVSLNDTLNTGKDIIIPPYIPTGIYSEPYLPPNAMFNYLSQGLQLDDYHFPKPKQKKKRHGFFKRLIVTVVAVVAAVVSMGTLAPALAGIFASMHLFAANVLATMAAAAVANVTTQATAMLLGVQKRFNWRSLAASIATAPIGMNHTFGASTSFSSIVGDIMISTAQNVLSQAIQGQVDIGNVVLTAFITAAGAQVPHHFQFPRIEMQNAFIAVTSTAFADMIENHGRINPENIAIAMAGVAAAYGANEINKKLAEYLPKKEIEEKRTVEKPVAKRLNPKAPLSQKELQDVKNAQSRLQKPSAKTPASRSRWQPASGNEMENDVGDIFSAMVKKSFEETSEPRGAKESRNINDARIEKVAKGNSTSTFETENDRATFEMKRSIADERYKFVKGALLAPVRAVENIYSMFANIEETSAAISAYGERLYRHPADTLSKTGQTLWNGLKAPFANGDGEALGGFLGDAVSGSLVGKGVKTVVKIGLSSVGAAAGGVAGVAASGSTWSTAAARATLFGENSLARMRGAIDVLDNPLTPSRTARNFAPKTAAQMAEDLRRDIGQNSVPFRTPNKAGHIDLWGDRHFDKVTEKYIDTPHVQTYDLHVGPNGKVSISRKTEIIRAATKSDIRIAKSLAEQQGLLKMQVDKQLEAIPGRVKP